MSWYWKDQQIVVCQTLNLITSCALSLRRHTQIALLITPGSHMECYFRLSAVVNCQKSEERIWLQTILDRSKNCRLFQDPHLHKWPTIQRHSISNNGPGEKFPGKAHLPYSTLEYGTWSFDRRVTRESLAERHQFSEAPPPRLLFQGKQFTSSFFHATANLVWPPRPTIRDVSTCHRVIKEDYVRGDLYSEFSYVLNLHRYTDMASLAFARTDHAKRQNKTIETCLQFTGIIQYLESSGRVWTQYLAWMRDSYCLLARKRYTIPKILNDLHLLGAIVIMAG